MVTAHGSNLLERESSSDTSHISADTRAGHGHQALKNDHQTSSKAVGPGVAILKSQLKQQQLNFLEWKAGSAEQDLSLCGRDR